ncbi:MAG TPA: DUF1501 domain-containing protein, partial [Planctomycetes bacterium]|nr:DUF1501 domain-containing protein [Planctomycetota bacterium]
MTKNRPLCGRVQRRQFLSDIGMGFTGLALASMLNNDGRATASERRASPNGDPHFKPKAKSVIWYF